MPGSDVVHEYRLVLPKQGVISVDCIEAIEAEEVTDLNHYVGVRVVDIAAHPKKTILADRRRIVCIKYHDNLEPLAPSV